MTPDYAPTPGRIRKEWMETTNAMLKTDTVGDWAEERRRANMLLDLYIDLGYLGTEVSLEPIPAQGYEPMDYDGA
jgi:hypothetical protein